MKTTVVPAQITTVEDRIIGNLTFAQILLLVVPLLTSTAIYASMTPRLDLSTLKLILILAQFTLFGILALRINGKILADWLVVYLRFSLRPRIYVFTKNDVTARDLPVFIDTVEIPQDEATVEPVLAHPALSFSDQLSVEQLMGNPSLSVSFELAKKGGVNVSLSPIKR